MSAQIAIETERGVAILTIEREGEPAASIYLQVPQIDEVLGLLDHARNSCEEWVEMRKRS